MKKTFTVMTMVMALVLSTMAAAFAQAPPSNTDLWDNEDVLDWDSETTEVTDPFEPDPDPEDPIVPQAASVTLTGPAALDTNQSGTYTVEVTNLSADRDLDEWVLGLGVDNITDVDDVTISFAGGDGFDLTGGTTGVTVELDEGNSVLYLRGSDDPTVVFGTPFEVDFDVTFTKEGTFTGTAYVIDEDPFRNVTVESEEFFSYYNADGGVDENVPPPTKPLNSDGTAFESGATYEFDFCTLDRTRYEIDGTRVLSLNNQKCYNDGVVEYQHRALMMNVNHPDFAKYEAAGHEVGFGGAWLMLSFEVTVPGGITVDVTDRDDITTWASFPE